MARFGYESIGGSQMSNTDRLLGTRWLGAAGVAVSMAIYAQWYGNQNCRLAIYRESDRVLIDYTNSFPITLTQWTTTALQLGADLEAVNYYLICCLDGGNVQLKYDGPGGKVTAYENLAFNGLPDPWAQTNWGISRAFSIYVNYNAAVVWGIAPLLLDNDEFYEVEEAASLSVRVSISNKNSAQRASTLDELKGDYPSGSFYLHNHYHDTTPKSCTREVV